MVAGAAEVSSGPDEVTYAIVAASEVVGDDVCDPVSFLDPSHTPRDARVAYLSQQDQWCPIAQRSVRGLDPR